MFGERHSDVERELDQKFPLSSKIGVGLIVALILAAVGVLVGVPAGWFKVAQTPAPTAIAVSSASSDESMRRVRPSALA